MDLLCQFKMSNFHNIDHDFPYKICLFSKTLDDMTMGSFFGVENINGSNRRLTIVLFPIA